MSQGIREQFRSMGLTEEEISESMQYMLNEDADLDEGEPEEEEGEDILSVVEAYKKVRKLRGKKKMQAKRYRRSAAGKKAAKKAAKRMKRIRKTSAYKRRVKKLAKMGGARKGYRRMVADRDVDGTPNIIENIQSLAEGIDKEPEDRFGEFAEAFNHIADIGELLTFRYHSLEESEMAADVIGLAADAEEVISYMEGLDGVLTPEQDEELEEALSILMSAVAEALEEYGAITESEDEDDDEYDEYEEDEDIDEDEDDDEDDELDEWEEDDEEDDDYPF